MTDKAKQNTNATEAPRLPFSVTPFNFEFTSPVPIDECVTRLKKLSLTEPPSEVALLRIDADNQRFNIRTRALRSHVVEAKGYLRKIDTQSTGVTGEAYGDSMGIGLVAWTILIVCIVILVTGSVWAVVLGIMAVVVLAIYIRRFVARVDADEQELARLIQSALS